MAPIYDSYQLEIDPERYGLGSLTAIHRVRIGYLIQQAIVSLAVSGLTFAAVWFTRNGVPRLVQHFLILLLVAFAMAIIGVLWQLTRNLRLRVLVFDDGIACIRGRRMIICRWDEIDAVWCRETASDEQGFHRFLWFVHPPAFANFIFMGGFHAYGIEMHDNRKLTLTSCLDEIERLGATLLNATGQRLLNQALATFDSGRSIEFGPFEVSPAGVRKGKRMLPWEQIEEAAIEQAIVVVKKIGESGLPWLWSTPESVPNVHVLIPLVNEIVSRHVT